MRAIAFAIMYLGSEIAIISYRRAPISERNSNVILFDGIVGIGSFIGFVVCIIFGA